MNAEKHQELRQHAEAAFKITDAEPDRYGLVGFHLASILAELDHLEETDRIASSYKPEE